MLRVGASAALAFSGCGSTSPQASPDKVVFDFGATHFEADAAIGGRITSLRAGASELLSSKQVDSSKYGATFWPSPQANWSNGPWPPPASLDKLAYDASISGLSATLTSQLDPDNHLRVRKQLTANVDDEAVEIDYSISNEGGAAVSWAPWEITRVAATGVTFWPTGSTPTPGKQPLLESHDEAGHTWIDIAALPVDEAKLLADGAGGWLAHVAGDSILIKQFQDLPASSAAPGEAEIEVFINTDHTYVEIEPQGAYASIEPGASVHWKVKWYARKLPAGITAAVGSADLIAFVTQTLK